MIQVVRVGATAEEIGRKLRDGENPDAVDEKNWTALHHCAAKGLTSCIVALLHGGATVDAATDDGKTALHFSAIGGSLSVCDTLLAYGATASACDRGKQTPLHKAALNGHGAVAVALIDAGAAINDKSNGGSTPLHNASKWGHTKVVRTLLARGANPLVSDNDNRTPLDVAKEGKHDETVEVLKDALESLEERNRWCTAAGCIIDGSGESQHPSSGDPGRHFGARTPEQETRKALEQSDFSRGSGSSFSVEMDEGLDFTAAPLVPREVVTRNIGAAGGVLTTTSGAQVWIPQGGLLQESEGAAAQAITMVQMDPSSLLDSGFAPPVGAGGGICSVNKDYGDIHNAVDATAASNVRAIRDIDRSKLHDGCDLDDENQGGGLKEDQKDMRSGEAVLSPVMRFDTQVVLSKPAVIRVPHIGGSDAVAREEAALAGAPTTPAHSSALSDVAERRLTASFEEAATAASSTASSKVGAASSSPTQPDSSSVAAFSRASSTTTATQSIAAPSGGGEGPARPPSSQESEPRNIRYAPLMIWSETNGSWSLLDRSMYTIDESFAQVRLQALPRHLTTSFEKPASHFGDTDDGSAAAAARRVREEATVLGFAGPWLPTSDGCGNDETRSAAAGVGVGGEGGTERKARGDALLRPEPAAGLSAAAPKPNRSRFVVYVVPNKPAAVRSAVLERMARLHPRLRLCAESLEPLPVGSTDVVTVKSGSSNGGGALAGDGTEEGNGGSRRSRKYTAGKPLPFDLELFEQRNLVTVENTTSGESAELVVHLLPLPLRPPMPLLEKFSKTLVVIRIPSNHSGALPATFAGFRPREDFELRFAMISRHEFEQHAPPMSSSSSSSSSILSIENFEPLAEQPYRWRHFKLHAAASPEATLHAPPTSNFDETFCFVQCRAVNLREPSLASDWSDTLIVRPPDEIKSIGEDSPGVGYKNGNILHGPVSSNNSSVNSGETSTDRSPADATATIPDGELNANSLVGYNGSLNDSVQSSNAHSSLPSSYLGAAIDGSGTRSRSGSRPGSRGSWSSDHSGSSGLTDKSSARGATVAGGGGAVLGLGGSRPGTAGSYALSTSSRPGTANSVGSSSALEAALREVGDLAERAALETLSSSTPSAGLRADPDQHEGNANNGVGIIKQPVHQSPAKMGGDGGEIVEAAPEQSHLHDPSGNASNNSGGGHGAAGPKGVSFSSELVSTFALPSSPPNSPDHRPLPTNAHGTTGRERENSVQWQLPTYTAAELNAAARADPEEIADACRAAATEAILYKKCCATLARRALAVAAACKHNLHFPTTSPPSRSPSSTTTPTPSSKKSPSPSVTPPSMPRSGPPAPLLTTLDKGAQHSQLAKKGAFRNTAQCRWSRIRTSLSAIISSASSAASSSSTSSGAHSNGSTTPRTSSRQQQAAGHVVLSLKAAFSLITRCTRREAGWLSLLLDPPRNRSSATGSDCSHGSVFSTESSSIRTGVAPATLSNASIGPNGSWCRLFYACDFRLVSAAAEFGVPAEIVGGPGMLSNDARALSFAKESEHGSSVTYLDEDFDDDEYGLARQQLLSHLLQVPYDTLFGDEGGSGAAEVLVPYAIDLSLDFGLGRGGVEKFLSEVRTPAFTMALWRVICTASPLLLHPTLVTATNEAIAGSAKEGASAGLGGATMEGASALLWLNRDPGAAGIASASAGDDGNASTPLRDRAGRIYPASPTTTAPSLHLRSRPFGAHATMCDVYLSGVLREVSDGAATAGGRSSGDCLLGRMRSDLSQSFGLSVLTSEDILRGFGKTGGAASAPRQSSSDPAAASPTSSSPPHTPSLLELLDGAIRSCGAFVVLFTPTYGDAASAKYTQREFETARRLNKPILPLLLLTSSSPLSSSKLRNRADSFFAFAASALPPIDCEAVLPYPSRVMDDMRAMFTNLGLLQRRNGTTKNVNEDAAPDLRRDLANVEGLHETSTSSGVSLGAAAASTVNSSLPHGESFVLEDWLARYNLSHIAPSLRDLGASAPSDLQDLEDDDLHALVLKPLELRRFKRARREFFEPQHHPPRAISGASDQEKLHFVVKSNMANREPHVNDNSSVGGGKTTVQPLTSKTRDEARHRQEEIARSDGGEERQFSRGSLDSVFKASLPSISSLHGPLSPLEPLLRRESALGRLRTPPSSSSSSLSSPSSASALLPDGTLVRRRPSTADRMPSLPASHQSPVAAARRHSGSGLRGGAFDDGLLPLGRASPLRAALRVDTGRRRHVTTDPLPMQYMTLHNRSNHPEMNRESSADAGLGTHRSVISKSSPVLGSNDFIDPNGAERQTRLKPRISNESSMPNLEGISPRVEASSVVKGSISDNAGGGNHGDGSRNALSPITASGTRGKELWSKVRSVVKDRKRGGLRSLTHLVSRMPQDFQQNMLAFAIPREDLKISDRPFAAGGGGQIFKGTYNRSLVAAKAIFSQMRTTSPRKNDEYKPEKHTGLMQEFHREFEMLATCHHPNIVTFYGISEEIDSGILYIVEEFCDGGDLLRFLNNSPEKVTPTAFTRLVTELLGGVKYMHDRGIAHRDLKPQNVLLTVNGRVKICDLGQARSFAKKGRSGGGIGTAAYMPPEAFDESVIGNDESKYQASAWDVYSLSVILWQLWFRVEPWAGFPPQKIIVKVLRGKRPSFKEDFFRSKNKVQTVADVDKGGEASSVASMEKKDEISPLYRRCPSELQSLIEDMWSAPHASRPSVRQICETFDISVVPTVRALGQGLDSSSSLNILEPPTPAITDSSRKIFAHDTSAAADFLDNKQGTLALDDCCVGDRVAHVQRGNGTVVVVEETAASANPRVHVKFDASGDTHRYDAVSLSSGKITRLSNERDGSIN